MCVLLLVLNATGDREFLCQWPDGLQGSVLSGYLVGCLPDIVVEDEARLVGWGLGEFEWCSDSWLCWGEGEGEEGREG